MRRIGPKGQGEFERISWDDALATIKQHWCDIISRYGAEAILPYGFAGNLGLLNGPGCGDALFNKLGATTAEKTFCVSSSITAQIMTIGPSLGTDPESFVHSKFILIWGANPLSTHSHLWPFILKAQRSGAKVVVIDPFRTRTAARADWHIAPRPGTDIVLALSMIHTLISDDLVDHDYVRKYCIGFDELAESAARYPADKAAEITGIAAEDIQQLAHEYAQTQPSVIRVGVGLERHQSGGQAMRAIDCLPALVGAWRQVGGGLLQMPIFVPVRPAENSRPDWIDPETRVLNLVQIGAHLTGELDPPVKSLFIWNANPLVHAPDSNKVQQGLERQDLFTVISEQFMTDTARYADIVLPATMAAEQDDILTSWGHFYINLNQRAIEPPGEAVANSELFRRLAKIMNLDDAHFQRTDLQMMRDSLDWDSPMLAGESFESLQERGTIRVKVPPANEYAPHAEGNFLTPSGKCEFVSSIGAESGFVVPSFRQMRMDKQNSAPINPVPTYTANVESIGEDNSTYPLQFLSPKSHGFLNSEYANETRKLDVQGEQAVIINPVDAAKRHIKTGDEVRVFNDRGAVIGDALVSDKALVGTVVATFGYWTSLSRGTGVNALTGGERQGFAATPCFYDTAVEVSQNRG
ncbi:MAG: molybdopterin-dependent oxidoreductase [Gammaproteobacteria bacterium]|nr:molybdopterin-dependent oxidoreductase [Gammaproteobacteria bacterium]